MKHYLPTEYELIALLKAGEKKGFDLLYERYARCLYSITLKIVRRREIAEDVLQDSFIKIWKNMYTYDQAKGSLFTFLLNITRNTAIDKTRSLGYKCELCGLTFIDEMVDKKDYVCQQVDYLGMDKYINRLTPQHKNLIDYVYLKGYTHEQTASILKIPLGTAKSRLKMAVSQLKLMVI
jgi:RNA polymerase sigma-70 factor, ECF subfamily